MKDGVFMSSKYHSQSITMASPHIVCMANWLPDFEQLTADRWRLVNAIALRDALLVGGDPDQAISTIKSAELPFCDEPCSPGPVLELLPSTATVSDRSPSPMFELPPPTPVTAPDDSALTESLDSVIDLTEDDEPDFEVPVDSDDERPGLCSWGSCAYDTLELKACSHCSRPVHHCCYIQNCEDLAERNAEAGYSTKRYCPDCALIFT
eukprot:m.471539 g.471539  ORF g.471539 m.471539 type:complete len:208 (-) comp31193_c0_seq1:35-658(-)